MNWEKLEAYIKSFHKEKGKFEKEEVLKIGLAHRKLKRHLRSFKKLNEFIGYSSVRALKDIINRNLNIMPKESPALKEDSDGIDREFEKLYKVKTQIRDSMNYYRRGLRDEARIEDIKDTIKYAADKQSKLPVIKFNGSIKNGESEAILLLSDWHIGEDSDNFYNKFNSSIARKRIKRIVEEAIHYCNINKVNTLHVLNLGDLIEGIINTNARIEQEKDVCTQLMEASEYLAEALNQLQSAAPRVTYRSVVDNHSRSIADKHQNIAKENLNRITDWFIKERLKDSDIEFIDDNLDIGLGRFTCSNGMKVAFAHGHEGNKNTSLQELVGATQDWTDIFCIAHWHSPAEKVYQNMRVFINGSLCGTGPYALSKRLFTKPSQKLIILNHKNIINVDINADVE